MGGWQKGLAAGHGHGAVMVPQLWNVGAVRRKGMEPASEVGGMGPEDMV